MPAVPFSFKFAVPGVSNPFTHTGTREHALAPGKANSHERDAPAAMHPSATADSRHTRRPASPCLVPPQPLAKKRGWVLPNAEPSVSTAAGSTTGYLDTPSKYRDMAENIEQDAMDEMVGGEHPSFSALAVRGNSVRTRIHVLGCAVILPASGEPKG